MPPSSVQRSCEDMAPVVIHVNLDRMGHFMETDEFYRDPVYRRIGALHGTSNCGFPNRSLQNSVFSGLCDAHFEVILVMLVMLSAPF